MNPHLVQNRMEHPAVVVRLLAGLLGADGHRRPDEALLTKLAVDGV